jgi:signal peptidase I
MAQPAHSPHLAAPPAGPGDRPAPVPNGILANAHFPLLGDLITDGFTVRLRVTGRSMAPYLRDHDLVTLRPVAPATIRLGDLVLTQQPGLPPLLHRVISRASNRDYGWLFRTKGDAIGRPDPPVGGEHVIARAVVISRELRLGVCVERRLDHGARLLAPLLALASRLTPRLFAALSRRLVPRLDTIAGWNRNRSLSRGGSRF